MRLDLIRRPRGYWGWLLLLFPPLALAGGNEVGNGGNAVVCARRVELLDFYEARVLRGVRFPRSGESGADPFAIAAAKIASLKGVDPKTSASLANGLSRLRKRMSLESGLKLRPIDDSEHGFEPRDRRCRVEQLAVYRKQVLPGEKAVLVNRRLWDSMSVYDKSGLLLHETWYKYLANLGERDSRKARYLVSFLMSTAYSPRDAEKYWSLIRKLKLPVYR